MAVKDVAERVEELILPLFNENDYELVDIEFVKEGPNWYLRIYADKENGITIDDCEIISRKAEAVLDEKDIIEQAYILEVSSPGIDRPLKKEEDFVYYKDEIIDIKLYKAIDKVKSFQGRLIGMENDIIQIETEDNKILSFERENVASCRLAVIF